MSNDCALSDKVLKSVVDNNRLTSLFGDLAMLSAGGVKLSCDAVAENRMGGAVVHVRHNS